MSYILVTYILVTQQSGHSVVAERQADICFLARRRKLETRFF